MSETSKPKSIFELDEFKPYEQDFKARVKELNRRKGYYDGSAYARIKDVPIYGPRLYKGIKPLYLMLARAVDIDAGIVSGGWEMAEDAPEAWSVARDTLFDMSDWDVDGVLYIHYGAQFGLSGLKVSDLRDLGLVVVKPIDPTTFLLLGGGYGQPPELALIVETRQAGGETFEYAEVIEPSSIRTYRDGDPYGYDERPPEYPNDLGFVPMVEVRHIETGEKYGECTFQKAIPMLDEVNELASYLADIIKKHAEPQWAVMGAEPSDLVKSGDNVWFIPQGGDAKALVAAVDIKGVLEFIQDVRGEVKASLAELGFDDLREKTQIATATLELQLMELVLKIKRCRPNYDHGLADAMRMAGRAAATMSLADLTILDDPELQFDQNRPVLPLDPETEIQLEMQQLALERERAMGTSEGMPPNA